MHFFGKWANYTVFGGFWGYVMHFFWPDFIECAQLFSGAVLMESSITRENWFQRDILHRIFQISPLFATIQIVASNRFIFDRPNNSANENVANTRITVGSLPVSFSRSFYLALLFSCVTGWWVPACSTRGPTGAGALQGQMDSYCRNDPAPQTRR